MRPLAITLLVAGMLALEATVARAQTEVQLRGIGALTEHRLAYESGRERPDLATGLAFGVGAATMLRGIEVDGHLYGGSLTGAHDDDEDRALSELSLRGGVLPFPWFALQLGATLRSYSTPLFTQRWAVITAGGEARMSLLDGAVQGRVRAALAPIVGVTDMASPDLGVQLTSALDWRKGAFSAGVEYAMERYDFRSGAERRYDQLTTLRAHIGLRVLR